MLRGFGLPLSVSLSLPVPSCSHSLSDHRAGRQTSGASRSRAGPLERQKPADEKVPGSPPMSRCKVPTSQQQPGWTTGKLKSLPMPCHGTMVHTWQWTPRWVHHPADMDQQGKARAYAELVRGSRCRLVVVAMGKGTQKVRLLPKARSRTAVKISIGRWSALHTLVAHVPLAASLNTQGPAQSTLLEHCPARPPSPASFLCLRLWPPPPALELWRHQI